MPIRYRRTSVRTLLGVTQEEKRIKRELGITAMLRPFRWWGNEKRDIRRDLGYYDPSVRLARHVLPHQYHKLVLIALVLLATPFALGYWLKSITNNGQPPQRTSEIRHHREDTATRAGEAAR